MEEQKVKQKPAAPEPAPTSASPPEQEETTKGWLDPEMRLMGMIIREIKKLDDPEAGQRIMDYLYARYKAGV